MSRPNSLVLSKTIVLTAFCAIAILGLWWWGMVRTPRNRILAHAEDSLARMEHTINREMSRAESTGLAFGAWWKREQGRLDDPEHLQNAISFLEKGAIITNLILSREDGDSACIVRKEGEWNLVLFRAGRNPRRFMVRKGHWVPGPMDGKDVYFARERHWYRFGAAQPGPAWTPEAYRHYTSRVGGYTFTVPVRNDSGHLEGVIGVDVSLEELTQLIWEHQPTPGTRMLVTDSGNHLLVPPRTPEMADQGTRFETHLRPLPATALAEFAQGKAAGHPGAGGLLQPGSDYVSRSGTYSVPGKPEMNLHVAIPEEDLFPGLHHRRLFMLMLAVGAVIAASWGILDLHHRFVRPMRALAKDSGPACDDWASPEIDSDIWEIQHLDQRLRKGGQAIQERNQLLLQVEQSQRADSIAMMAPGIIHDVNNHLSLVLGQLALCQKLSKNHPDLQPRLQVAEGAALRCSEVLRGLLDYSRPGPGGRELLNLNAAVQDACGLLQRVLGKAIQLEEELGPVPLVFGEPVKLQQVLINLGMNARDAMPGGGVLRFRTFRRGDHACLEVEDTGCGMSPETQRRVFEPFFTTKEVGKGTGLGLAMVSNIVSAHGGTIDLHSEPGKGTRFHLEFPDSLRK